MSFRQNLLSLSLLMASSAPALAWSYADVVNQPKRPITVVTVQESSGVASFRMPQGWQVDARWVTVPGTAEPRWIVHIASPDSALRMQLSDPVMPQLFLFPGPGRTRGQSGIVGGVRAVVLPYLTGAQYAQFYAKARYDRPDACRQFQVTDAVDTPVPPNMPPAPGMQVAQETAGYAFFTCVDAASGQTLDGVVSAATVAGTANGLVGWSVPWLWHSIAAPNAAVRGFAITRFIAGSIQVNPQALAAKFPVQVTPPTPSPAPPGLPGSGPAGPSSDPWSGFKQLMEGETTTPGGSTVPIGPNGGYYWHCNPNSSQFTNTQSYLSPGPSCRQVQ